MKTRMEERGKLSGGQEIFSGKASNEVGKNRDQIYSWNFENEWVITYLQFHRKKWWNNRRYQTCAGRIKGRYKKRPPKNHKNVGQGTDWKLQKDWALLKTQLGMGKMDQKKGCKE